MSVLYDVFGMVLNPRDQLLLINQKHWELPSTRVGFSDAEGHIEGIVGQLEEIFPDFVFDSTDFNHIYEPESKISLAVYRSPENYDFKSSANELGFDVTWIDWGNQNGYDLREKEIEAIDYLHDLGRFRF